MRGTALIYRPEAREPEVRELVAPAGLALLQGAVGGYIELVPGFATIAYRGEARRCHAFCNEHGKLDDLPFNAAATELWHAALPPPGLLRRDGGLADVLVGPVIVLFGDREFMDEM